MSETVADIVRDMRGYAAGMAERYKEAVEGDKYLACSVISLRMGRFANRIEAAYKRELTEQKGDQS